MKRVYETQFDVGESVRWDYFGMPLGAEDKAGEGKIVGVSISQYTSTHHVRYDIESDRRVVLDVPETCVMKQVFCGAV